MKTKKQKDAEAARKREPKPILDAHAIDNKNRLRIGCACDSCSRRFNVDFEDMRRDGEMEVNCPYCKRKMLVQHVEYVVAMIVE